MFEAENFPDVIVPVKCMTREFKAHKALQATRSEVKTMFTHDTKKAQEGRVANKDVEPSVVNGMLKYIYTGTLDGMTEEAAVNMIIVADK